MKPFNLIEYYNGAKVCTRDGREVTEIYHFKTMNEKRFRTLAAIIDGECNYYFLDGKVDEYQETRQDLMIKPVTKKYYVNIYKFDNHLNSGQVHSSLEEANSYLGSGTRVKLLEFEVEE